MEDKEKNNRKECFIAGQGSSLTLDLSHFIFLSLVAESLNSVSCTILWVLSLLQLCHSESLAPPTLPSFNFGTAELSQQPRKRLHCSIPGSGKRRKRETF